MSGKPLPETALSKAIPGGNPAMQFFSAPGRSATGALRNDGDIKPAFVLDNSRARIDEGMRTGIDFLGGTYFPVVLGLRPEDPLRDPPCVSLSAVSLAL